jgi:hypothetical protein
MIRPGMAVPMGLWDATIVIVGDIVMVVVSVSVAVHVKVRV